jgi:hypothetical protein
MKTSYLSKWDSINESPRPVTRARVAELLRASRSRRGKGNTWRTALGYWVRDAGLTLIRATPPKSNFPHPLPFVMQAWDSSLEKWLDTIHGGHTQAEAETTEKRVRAEPSHWMRGTPTRTRIVPALRVKP